MRSVLHTRSGEELPLLDVHDLACASRRCDEIGLSAQEGGDLKYVYIFGSHLSFLSLMNISHDGDIEGLPHSSQYTQSSLITDPGEAIYTRAVGFAVRSLEDVGYAEACSDI